MNQSSSSSSSLLSSQATQIIQFNAAPCCVIKFWTAHQQQLITKVAQTVGRTAAKPVWTEESHQ